MQLVYRLAQGVSQDDLSGHQVRQQFRSMCTALVDAVEAVSQSAPPADRKGFEVASLPCYPNYSMSRAAFPVIRQQSHNLFYPSKRHENVHA